jgi:hypothetical protein
LEKKKNEKRQNFNKRINFEFWYPEDLLVWISEEFQKDFKTEINKIKNMMSVENKRERNIDILRAIERLEKKGRIIKQETVAREWEQVEIFSAKDLN